MPRIIDISPLISPRLALWPGDAPFHATPIYSHEHGHAVDLARVETSLHLGAHVDAPRHVIPSGAGIESADLSAFIGPCEVIEVQLPAGFRILPEHLPQPIRAPRVLFKTRTSQIETFRKDFSALSLELIAHLKAQGCVLVGLDTPSADCFASKDFPCHRALLESGMNLLEGLVLDEAPAGLYELCALPLKIEGGDGSPVRAVLLADEPQA